MAVASRSRSNWLFYSTINAACVVYNYLESREVENLDWQMLMLCNISYQSLQFTVFITKGVEQED